MVHRSFWQVITKGVENGFFFFSSCRRLGGVHGLRKHRKVHTKHRKVHTMLDDYNRWEVQDACPLPHEDKHSETRVAVCSPWCSKQEYPPLVQLLIDMQLLDEFRRSCGSEASVAIFVTARPQQTDTKRKTRGETERDQSTSYNQRTKYLGE